MKTTRITIDLTEQDQDALRRAMEMSGDATKAEAIRNAVRLYENLHRWAQEGYRFFGRAQDGTLAPMLVGIAPRRKP